jgi:hypothetical protein
MAMREDITAGYVIAGAAGGAVAIGAMEALSHHTASR